MRKYWDSIPPTARKTVVLIIATIVVWILWDVPVAIERTAGDTESEILRDWGWMRPSFAWAVGVLAGHWWWNGKDYTLKAITEWAPLGLIPVAAVIVWADFAGHIPWVMPILVVAAGVPFGKLFWAQEPKAPAGEAATEGSGGQDKS